MTSKSALLCALVGLVSGQDLRSADCADGISCSQVAANGLTFDCRFAGQDGTAGNVLLLHGFPEWSEMYNDLMRTMASNGFSSVACDQRGYSLGASPPNVEDYNYNNLRDDVFAVADAVGFDKFHLVAHDHGAVLGWYAAGSDRGAERFLTYTAMSIPHIDAFSKALDSNGDKSDQDIDQQIASQYFTMFIEDDSATSHMRLFCNMFRASSRNFKSCEHVQHALWWYNGAILEAGAMTLPRWMSSGELLLKGNAGMSLLRANWGGHDIGPHPQTSPTGPVSMPVLYVCGSTDDSILCNKPYALKTQDYCPAGYSYLEVNCGHGLLKCHDHSETQKVIDGIVNHLKGEVMEVV